MIYSRGILEGSWRTLFREDCFHQEYGSIHQICSEKSLSLCLKAVTAIFYDELINHWTMEAMRFFLPKGVYRFHVWSSNSIFDLKLDVHSRMKNNFFMALASCLLWRWPRTIISELVSILYKNWYNGTGHEYNNRRLLFALASWTIVLRTGLAYYLNWTINNCAFGSVYILVNYWHTWTNALTARSYPSWLPTAISC